MKDQTVTLTLSVSDAAVMSLMLKQAVALAESVVDDDDKPTNMRFGALVAMAQGLALLRKVTDKLKEVVGEEVEEEQGTDEEMTLDQALQELNITVHHVTSGAIH